MGRQGWLLRRGRVRPVAVGLRHLHTGGCAGLPRKCTHHQPSGTEFADTLDDIFLTFRKFTFLTFYLLQLLMFCMLKPSRFGSTSASTLVFRPHERTVQGHGPSPTPRCDRGFVRRSGTPVLPTASLDLRSVRRNVLCDWGNHGAVPASRPALIQPSKSRLSLVNVFAVSAVACEAVWLGIVPVPPSASNVTVQHFHWA